MTIEHDGEAGRRLLRCEDDGSRAYGARASSVLHLGLPAIARLGNGRDVRSYVELTLRSVQGRLVYGVQLPQTADALERRLSARIARVRSRAASPVFLRFFILLTSLSVFMFQLVSPDCGCAARDRQEQHDSRNQQRVPDCLRSLSHFRLLTFFSS